MAKIAVIRISGRVDVVPKVKKTFEELKMDRKFSCIVIDDKPEIMGMIKRVQDHVCFGPVKEHVLKELILKRGKFTKKVNEKEMESIAKEFMENKKTMDKVGLKKVFHLHPPRGGFKKSTFLPYPQGILGKNEKINELILRML
jgi:large subunit ribosomal protein L30